MAQTLFYTIIIEFAHASAPLPDPPIQADKVFRLVEQDAGFLLFVDNEQLNLSQQAQEQLRPLIAVLEEPLPESGRAISGADGTWYTLLIQEAAQLRSYRWWIQPPEGWESLAGVVEFVMKQFYQHRDQQLLPMRSVIAHFRDMLISNQLNRLLDCYHADIHFIDPLFDVYGSDVTLLWRLRHTVQYDFAAVQHDDRLFTHEHGGGLNWGASYIYPPTGKRVTLSIHSNLRVADGKIIEQQDHYNLQNWIRLAYGSLAGSLGRYRIIQYLAVRQAQSQLDILRNHET